MIRKSAHKDTVNPPGQIVNFEKPVIKEITEYQQKLQIPTSELYCQDYGRCNCMKGDCNKGMKT